MKTYKVIIHRYAAGQMRAIRRHIEVNLKSPISAKATVDALRQEILSLSNMPNRISLTDEEPWRNEGYHRMLVRQYYVYFRVDEEKAIVHVTAVIYVKMEQTRQLELMELVED